MAAALARPEVDGIVVTHGTDVMEESAYLLDLTVPGDKPMTLTGAMRTASDLGYEGYANLAAAVRVAAADAARGLGALVVMNDEIHAARFVTKTHTLSLATFAPTLSAFQIPVKRSIYFRLTCSATFMPRWRSSCTKGDAGTWVSTPPAPRGVCPRAIIWATIAALQPVQRSIAVKPVSSSK